jgi:hypothetical protein
VSPEFTIADSPLGANSMIVQGIQAFLEELTITSGCKGDTGKSI